MYPLRMELKLPKRLYRGELNEVDVANGYGMGMATANRGNKVK